jgi:CubicO group peptidase (beta-lactamase class C family)
LEELELAIEATLGKTGTPGAGIALVSRDEVLWVGGIGIADRATGRTVDADTVFRVGSISKSFVSLAALRLQEHGRLSLQDKVRELVPEIEFANPWEEKNPVRLVHLLEHTAGFDDWHLGESAHGDPSLSLRDALDYHPHSRAVRWKPGTHFSYSNSGPAVAAYAIQKVTGQPYEDFIQENFFDKLQMATASFFLTNGIERNFAQGYKSDGVTPAPYGRVIMRPSGAINASSREMANFVQFLLNRGSFRGLTLLLSHSIQRMESPYTTLAARAGIRTGYALGSYTLSENGFLFHGHDGVIGGYLATYGYLPGEGLGYFYAINSSNGSAFSRIGKLVRAYLTRDLQPPTMPASAHLPPAHLQSLTGYYELITPRAELTRFYTRLADILRVTSENKRLRVTPLFRERRELIPVTDQQFRGMEDSLATSVFLEDLSGEMIFQDSESVVSGGSYRRVSPAFVWFQWVLAVTVLGLMTSSVSFALFWAFAKLYGKLCRVKYLSVRVLPLVAVLSLATAFTLLLLSLDGSEFVWRFGRLTAWSLGYCLFSLLFAVTAVAGLVQAVRAPSAEVQPSVRIHSILVSLANAVALVYLAYWGTIGLRFWAY